MNEPQKRWIWIGLSAVIGAAAFMASLAYFGKEVTLFGGIAFVVIGGFVVDWAISRGKG